MLSAKVMSSQVDSETGVSETDDKELIEIHVTEGMEDCLVN